MTTDGPDPAAGSLPAAVGLTPQQQARHGRLALLRAAGMDPYPVQVPRTTSVKQAHEAARADQTQTVSVVGRVVRLCDPDSALPDGGVPDGGVLAVLREGAAQVQALLDGTVDPAALDLFRRTVDPGDQVSVTGTTGRSPSGEPSLLVTAWTMAAKALTPPDEPADPATRARPRHVELALDADTADRVRARSAAVASVRTTLAWHSFTEVETPVLHQVPAAGTSPLRTRVDGYDQDLYLRSSPGPYLRRLVVGGLGKVFEVGRCFHDPPDAGPDPERGREPELTYLDACQAHGDCTTLRRLAQEIVRSAAAAVHGAAVAQRPDGRSADSGRSGTTVRLDGPDWPVVTVHDAVSQAVDAPLTVGTPLDEVRAVCRRTAVAYQDDEPAGVLVARLYDRLVAPATDTPVFYADFPVETAPSARAHRDDPRLAERWALVMFGTTVATACSGLADPVEQRRRLASADPAALDADLLTALEFGLPPTGSLSLGIDQMVATLLGTTVRDVLTFPFVR
ncbi:MAG: hypothetical protein FWH11_10030 [Micrococcales bacterium]|nr:hypothetical protein [Micrococcales bacterium]